MRKEEQINLRQHIRIEFRFNGLCPSVIWFAIYLHLRFVCIARLIDREWRNVKWFLKGIDTANGNLSRTIYYRFGAN